jgi:spore coat polysaccharide biosynthesis protein SpsF
MAKVVACIIARTVSQRLPLKVLRDFVPHMCMLDFLVRYARSQTDIDEVYICTSAEPVDDILEDVALRNGVKIYRGSADDVAERMLGVAAIEDADILIRITGDNPFTALEFVGHQVRFLEEQDLEYVRVAGLPIGGTAEVFTAAALRRCITLMDSKVSEYLMLFLFEPRNFRCGVIRAFEKDYSAYSLTVDRQDDFERTKVILNALHFSGDVAGFSIRNVLKVLDDDSIELPARTVQPSGTVKLPYGEEMAYVDFEADMRRRFNGSAFLSLHA